MVRRKREGLFGKFFSRARRERSASRNSSHWRHRIQPMLAPSCRFVTSVKQLFREASSPRRRPSELARYLVTGNDRSGPE
ncbi:MAG: hypothetical protein U1F57_03180 [bacterium]